MNLIIICTLGWIPILALGIAIAMIIDVIKSK